MTGLSSSIPTSSAPVRVNPSCGIPLLNQEGSVSSVANIAACGVSIFFTSFLIAHCHRRKAAVGMCLTFTHSLLLSNALVTTQVVEDGTLGSLIVRFSTHVSFLKKIHGISAFIHHLWSCFRFNCVYLSRHWPGNNRSHWRPV
jgi:hypothetical protein